MIYLPRKHYFRQIVLLPASILVLSVHLGLLCLDFLKQDISVLPVGDDVQESVLDSLVARNPYASIIVQFSYN